MWGVHWFRPHRSLRVPGMRFNPIPERASAHALLVTSAIFGWACTASVPPSGPTQPPSARASAGGGGGSARPASVAGPYHQLILIWLRDAPQFATYAQAAQPIAARYGALDQMYSPTQLYAEGLSKPDIVNLVHYNSRADVDALDADPEFQRIVPMRSASIDMVSVSGFTEWAQEVRGANAKRFYLLEIAQLPPEGRAAYDRYTARAARAMAPYGYNVERRLRVEESSGFGFEPDIVQIAYFDEVAGMEAFHRDPAHAELERSYGELVQRSVWILGAVHPQSPRRQVGPDAETP